MKLAAETVAFRLTLTPLTPLSVGSGRTLGRFDYSLTVNPRSGAPLVRVLDIERFIEESPLPPEKKTEAIEGRSATVLDRFSRYVLACQFRQAPPGLELLEFHRDGLGRPLVPASSLRGLLRTATLFSLLSTRPEALREGVDAALRGRWRRERAAETLERICLGSREEDALRAVRVGEPEPVSNEDLRAYEAAVLSLSGGSLRAKPPFHLEALNPRSGAGFAYPVSLRVPSAPPSPGLRGSAPAPLRGREDLLDALKSFAAAIVEGERRFYAETGARDLGRLLEETLRRAEGRIAIPFGLGSGWRSKTVGLLLRREDLQRLEPLLSPGRSFYRRGPAVLFPKSRRWVTEAGRPLEPLGWAAIEAESGGSGTA
jgi:CRISPR type III-A-associated RAMP protein Csm5